MSEPHCFPLKSRESTRYQDAKCFRIARMHELTDKQPDNKDETPQRKRHQRMRAYEPHMQSNVGCACLAKALETNGCPVHPERTPKGIMHEQMRTSILTSICYPSPNPDRSGLLISRMSLVADQHSSKRIVRMGLEAETGHNVKSCPGLCGRQCQMRKCFREFKLCNLQYLCASYE